MKGVAPIVLVHPSFTRGAARIANPYRGLTSYAIRTKGNVDSLAIASDWSAVGKDLDHAIKTYKQLARA